MTRKKTIEVEKAQMLLIEYTRLLRSEAIEGKLGLRRRREGADCISMHREAVEVGAITTSGRRLVSGQSSPCIAASSSGK